jgi:hypothetical protein
MTLKTPTRTVRRAAGYAAGLGALWLVVAVSRPETTFHLAPLLVAGVPAPALGIDTPHPDAPALLKISVAGIALALAVTGILASFDSLRGPSLLPFGGAVVESVILAFVGGTLGLVIALIRIRA